MSRTRRRPSGFNIFNVAFMTIFSLLIIIPIWSIVAESFNDPTLPRVSFWPAKFSTASYLQVFSTAEIWRSLLISVLKTVVGVITHVMFTAVVAYGLSKANLVGRKWYMAALIGTMYFSGGLIPTFLLYKYLGLLNNFWVYIIPALFSFYDMLIFMNFFRDIPDALEESAKIDGASTLRIFWGIILPLSMPVIATIALFNGVGQWNDYITAKLFVSERPDLFPVQMYLYNMITAQQAASTMQNAPVQVGHTTVYSLQLATMIITTVPIVAVYPFLQRYFIKGMLVGSVKG